MTIRNSKRFTRTAAVASVAMLGILAQGCTRDPNVRKAKFLESGKKYASQGKEKEAVIQFSNAIKVDPNFAAAHFELAKTYLKLGSGLAGYTELRRTVELDPKNVEARLDMGQILLASHQTAKSVEQAKAILELDPKNADAYSLLSGAAIASGDRAEAMKDIQQALALDPNKGAFHAQLGLIQGSDPTTAGEAEGQLRKAVSLDPKNSASHLMLAGMLEKKGDRPAAAQEAEIATQSDPKNVRAWVMLAGIYYRQGDKQKAEATLMRATDALHDNPDGAELLRIFFQQTGQRERAPVVYAELANKYPKSLPIKMAYAHVLLEQGETAKAQDLVTQLQKSNGGDPQVEAMNGMLLLRAGKVNEANTALEKGSKNAPDNVPLKFWLGQAQLAKGDIPGAQQSFKDVLRLNPNNLQAERALAGTAVQTQDFGLLGQLADQVLARDPNDGDGYTWRAFVKLHQNQSAAAEEDFTTALKKNPKDETALVALGQLRMKDKRYAEGTQMLEEALANNSNLLQPLQLLVSYDMSQHQPEKAIARVQAQIAKVPQSSLLYDQLAALQLATKDVQGAVNSSQKAMQLDPSDSTAVMVYTQAAVMQGNVGSAISKWQAWGKDHPTDARADVILGTLSEAQSNSAAAMDYYKKALAIQPDQPVAANNLAFLMLQNGQDVDVALSLAQTARRAMPHSPNTADTLAWAYYQKGIYGSARDLLEDALKTAPENASIQYHLGMAYTKLGDKANAVTHLKKAASLAPNTQIGGEASKALNTLG